MNPMAQPDTTLHSAALAHALADQPVFAGLPMEGLQWLASLMWEQVLEPGEVLLAEGSPADTMFVILEGELRARREAVADSVSYVLTAGEVSGMLPYSRMRVVSVTVRSPVRSRVACLHSSNFPAVIDRLPELGKRLVGVMSDRIREVAREDVQREKLVALGRLAGGLAHELNNPAAAVLSAIDSIRSAIAEWQATTVRLESLGLTPEQRDELAKCERECIEDLKNLPVLDSLAKSDREEQMAAMLLSHNIRDPWRLVPILVDSGFEEEDLECIASHYPPGALADVLARFASTLAIERLLSEVGMSAHRISDLVGSMKEYSFVDQAPVQELDLHRGLENTLTVLQHRIGPGIKVVRHYDSRIPPMSAYGSELNQVWTNLIENALDAMGDQGELCIRTQLEFDRALVEICDSGPGIPPEIVDSVFEPFFTTKPVGAGTGLGLDIVFRVVRKHHGDVRFESAPGCTKFQVQLPLAKAVNASTESGVAVS